MLNYETITKSTATGCIAQEDLRWLSP